MPTPLQSSPDQTIVSQEVFRLFQTYGSRRFVFVEPGGNEGDRLIYMGAERLARMANLKFRVMDHETFMRSSLERDTVIYLHGSGGFNPLYDQLPLQELSKAAEHEGVVIQGPATFWDDRQYLDRTVGTLLQEVRCERLIVMARENKSYDLLDGLQMRGAELMIDHDTSLNLTAGDLGAEAISLRHCYDLFSIREDREAADTEIRPLLSIWLDPAWQKETIETWLAIHAGARSIVTNRLHSSICGYLLGIPTTLLPNSYYKNRAVWEYSLAPRGVLWADRIEPNHWSHRLARVPGVAQLMQHSAMRRIVWRLRGLRI